MLKYIMLLCCLVATQAEAVKARRELSPDVVKICIAKDKGKELASKLNKNHKYLERMIKIYNVTMAVAAIKSDAIKTWNKTRVGYSFRSMPKRLIKPYEEFSEALIESSEDLETIYQRIPKKKIPVELFRDTKDLIDQVEDRRAKRYLKKFLTTTFTHTMTMGCYSHFNKKP